MAWGSEGHRAGAASLAPVPGKFSVGRPPAKSLKRLTFPERAPCTCALLTGRGKAPPRKAKGAAWTKALSDSPAGTAAAPYPASPKALPETEPLPPCRPRRAGELPCYGLRAGPSGERSLGRKKPLTAWPRHRLSLPPCLEAQGLGQALPGKRTKPEGSRRGGSFPGPARRGSTGIFPSGVRRLGFQVMPSRRTVGNQGSWRNADGAASGTPPRATAKDWPRQGLLRLAAPVSPGQGIPSAGESSPRRPWEADAARQGERPMALRRAADSSPRPSPGQRAGGLPRTWGEGPQRPWRERRQESPDRAGIAARSHGFRKKRLDNRGAAEVN
jgi:hypothetical protein